VEGERLCGENVGLKRRKLGCLDLGPKDVAWLVVMNGTVWPPIATALCDLCAITSYAVVSHV